MPAKLRVSQPGDPYKPEADRVADEVMRMPAPEAPVDAVAEELGSEGIRYIIRDP